MNELDASSLLAIVSHLKKPSDLLRAAQASTALASVCKAQSLWQQLVEERFDLFVSATPASFTTQSPEDCDPNTSPAPAPTCCAGGASASQADGAPEPRQTTATAGPAHGPTSTSSSQCRQLDLQETYKALATGPRPGALRFAAVFTDGGCDGMREGDLTYWADHAFQPNHWSPHCSDGRSNINIIGLLQPQGLMEDGRLSSHRTYLVERCAAAAAVLFSPPSAPHQTRDQAAASLTTWSTTGLERLFLDLYQDLWVHQQDSTWGRLLLSGVPQPEWPQELVRLGLTADSISGNLRHQAYSAVGKVPQHEVEAATAAAAAAAGSNGSSSQQGAGMEAGGAAAVVVMQAAAAGGGAQAGTALARKLQTAAAHAGGSSNGSSRRQDQQQQKEQELQRHMVDKRLLPWLSTPALTHSTGLVEEVVVSRIGHFTCPVAAGAVLLGQHPTLSSSNRRSSSGGDDSSSSESQQYQAVLKVKHDPLVAALDNCSSFEKVMQAVSAGVLPPLVQHIQHSGVEWCEFRPLSRQQRLQRQQQGWYMRPVVWFRFHSLQPQPAHAEAAGQQAAAADGTDVDQNMADGSSIDSAAPDAYAPGPAAAAGNIGGGAAVAMEYDYGFDIEVGSGSESDVESTEQQQQHHDSDIMPDELTFAMELPPAGWQQQQQQSPPAAAAGEDDAAAEEEEIDVMDVSSSGMPEADSAAGAAVDECGMQTESTGRYASTSQQHHQHQPQPQQCCELPGLNSSSSSDGGNGRKELWQQHGTSGVKVLPAPTSLQELNHSSSEPGVLLRMPLSLGPRSGNMALVKLINCENKMAEYDDPSEEPNIDVQYVALRGVAATLEEGCGLQLL